MDKRVTNNQTTVYTNIKGTRYGRFKIRTQLVYREIIYTGYFWTGFSSLGCDWVIIDLLIYNFKKELKVELSYPGIIIGDIIPDNRNNIRLLSILKKAGKLID